MVYREPDELDIPSEEEAIAGRETPIETPDEHAVLGTPLDPPYPDDTHTAVFGMGCFWGPEKLFWSQDGVHTTMVGYAGGYTPNPSYREVCSGRTGHTEVVRVVFRPTVVSYVELLELFWEGHDPTQGMRQGVDVGTQYRSAIYCDDDRQLEAALTSAEHYADRLASAGHGEISTEIRCGPEFYYAEPSHQQYAAKNPHSRCATGGTGVECGLERGG